MSNLWIPGCDNLAEAGFNQQQSAELMWEALLSAGAFIEGDFSGDKAFASGLSATLKVDAEVLYKHKRQFAIVLGLFASFPCVKEADVLLYVPKGMKKFINTLGRELGKPVAQTERIKGGDKYDFKFKSLFDQYLAQAAERPLIGEDVVTSLGSVAAIRALLGPDQDVHSISMLLRGIVTPEYQNGLRDHYLMIRQIPLEAEEFYRRLDANDWPEPTAVAKQ